MNQSKLTLKPSIKRLVWLAVPLGLALAACGQTTTPATSTLNPNEMQPRLSAESVACVLDSSISAGSGLVTGTVNLSKTCAPKKVSLVVYQAPSSSFDANTANQQVIFDVTTQTLDAGNHTLNVKLPDCYFQADLVFGEPIEQLGPAGSGNFYGSQDRLIRGLNGGQNTCMGTLHLRKIYDDASGQMVKGVTFDPTTSANGQYDYPERIFGGWPMDIIKLDSGGNEILSTKQTVFTQPEFAPGDGFFTTLPYGTYHVREHLPTGVKLPNDSTYPNAFWVQTGANVTEGASDKTGTGGTTTVAFDHSGGSVTDTLTVVITANQFATARFLNVCESGRMRYTFVGTLGAVVPFPDNTAWNDIRDSGWVCEPTFGTPVINIK